jgi:2-amino-4-hydroxy-6-hydroxymethyldihydropteridine diphosphokinase
MMPESTLNRAYLGLGANIDPHANLPAAVRELARYGNVVKVSQVWESVPVGFADQPNFLNAAVLLETPHSAASLREHVIPQVEHKLKRQRDPHNVNGPRTIDVDILLFNHEVLELGSHRIPDPELLDRPFVAIPLAELDPHYMHPETGQTLHSIAAQFDPLPDSLCVRRDVDLLRPW